MLLGLATKGLDDSHLNLLGEGAKIVLGALLKLLFNGRRKSHRNDFSLLFFHNVLFYIAGLKLQ